MRADHDEHADALTTLSSALLLLRCGRAPQDGATPLYCAAYGLGEEASRLLLAAAAAAAGASTSGASSAEVAAPVGGGGPPPLFGGCAGCIRVLVAAGASVDSLAARCCAFALLAARRLLHPPHPLRQHEAVLRCCGCGAQKQQRVVSSLVCPAAAPGSSITAVEQPDSPVLSLRSLACCLDSLTTLLLYLASRSLLCSGAFAAARGGAECSSRCRPCSPRRRSRCESPVGGRWGGGLRLLAADVAGAGREQNVAALVRAGAAVDICDSIGTTALQCAVTAGSPAACCEKLLLAGASPHMMNDEGETPLVRAVSR